MYYKNIKDEKFNEDHELFYYSRKNIVDKLTNQPIEEYSIGDGEFIKRDDIQIDKDEYYFIFKHGEASLILTGYRKFTENDLIRVDFKKKDIEIVKDFFV